MSRSCATTRTRPSAGRFFISLPAFEFLWSGHDVFLEHYRRYTLRQVRDVVQRAPD